MPRSVRDGSDPPSGRQDGYAHHSARCCDADPGADFRVPTLAPTDQGVDRGERRAVPYALVGRAPERRRGGVKRGVKSGFAAEVDTEIEAFLGPGALDGLDFEAIERATR